MDRYVSHSMQVSSNFMSLLSSKSFKLSNYQKHLSILHNNLFVER